jgi:hypothetical protein
MQQHSIILRWILCVARFGDNFISKQLSKLTTVSGRDTLAAAAIDATSRESARILVHAFLVKAVFELAEKLAEPKIAADIL